MRRTVRGLIDATIPSAAACRARSSLDQWVMCRPLATGSRQASSTIWARWRGGKPGRAARSLGLAQEARHPAVTVALAGASHGADVALQMGRGGRGPLPCGDGQDRSSATDLVPRQGLTPSDLLEDGSVMAADLERGRFPTTHGATSLAGTTLGYQQRGCPEFRALLRARHTRDRGSVGAGGAEP